MPSDDFSKLTHPFVHAVFDAAAQMEFVDSFEMMGDDGGIRTALLIHFVSAASDSHNIDFDAKTGEWTTGEFPLDHFGTLSVFESGAIGLVGEDAFDLDINLRSVGEIAEFVRLLHNGKKNVQGVRTTHTLPLTKLIQDVRIPVWLDGCWQTFSVLSQKTRKALPQDLEAYLLAALANDFEKLVELGGRTWSNLDESWLPTFRDQSQKLEDPDGFVVIGNSVVSVSPGACERRHSMLDSGLPQLILELNTKRVSRIYFREIAQFGTGLTGLFDIFSKPMRDLGDIFSMLSEIRLELPVSVEHQIATGIEHRATQRRAADAVAQLANAREGDAHMTQIRRQWLHAAESLARQSLQSLSAVLEPMPFFLEKPISAFNKADNHYEKDRRGRAFLNIVVRSCVSLALEELRFLSGNASLPSGIKDPLLSPKPLTDGEWHGLLRELHSNFLGDLDWTKSVVSACFSHQKQLDEVLKLRNADVHGIGELSTLIPLVEKMETTFAAVVSDLRDSFRGMEVIYPLGLDPGEVPSCRAMRVMGFDHDFDIVRYPVSGDATVWLKPNLLLLTDDGPIPLSNYFECEITTVQILDVRIFNKLIGERREFISILSDRFSD